MGYRTHQPGTRAGAQPGSPAGRRSAPQPADLLALQRLAGNRAARRVLARRDKGTAQQAPDDKPAQAVAPALRLLIADEDKHGLGSGVVADALAGVRTELLRITKDSRDPSVRAGFDVQYVKTPPARSDDFSRSLGRNTFLILITSGAKPEHAIEVMWQYIPMDESEREVFKAKFKKSLAKEGGVDLGFEPNARRRTSQSVGFVSSEAPLKELKKQGAGSKSASAVLADLILHELGHALGHNTTLAAIDHDDAGIMEPSLLLGSSGAHETRKFSTKSAKILRDRMEELAKKLTPRQP
jgi:hypothetical protein